MTGRDAEFHLEPGDGVAPMVEHLIARGGRPVVVSGPAAAGTGPVMVAYDGSAPSAKALQMATLLGVWSRQAALPARSMSCRSTATAPRRRELRRGRAPSWRRTVSRRHSNPVSPPTIPADFLMRRAGEFGARMLVMGAFGHRGFREILFGSCTRHLFNTAPLPLFIYH